MIVSGGENVYSGEVESAIYEIPEVSEVAVFGIPDDKWGKLVAAAVVLRPGTNLSAEELQQYCKTRIASYKVPPYRVHDRGTPQIWARQDSETSFPGEILGR